MQAEKAVEDRARVAEAAAQGGYEIGALRALDLLAVNSTVNNFDVYVGTSAGSFVAGMLANGVTPDEMMQVLNEREPSELEDLTSARC